MLKGYSGCAITLLTTASYQRFGNFADNNSLDRVQTMQRFLSSLLVMMLYVVSSNSSAQQFDSFRQIGEFSGTAAGTVTSITLAPTTSQISFFDAAGLSTVFDLSLIHI